MFLTGLDFDDMESFRENLDDIEAFKGLWPGAWIVYYLKEYDQDTQPVNSWVITDENDNRWFVLAAMISHPEKDILITYRYDPEIQFSSIAIFNVQYATRREYSALFKLIHALRQVSASSPGRRPDPSYDLAAGSILRGETKQDVLNKFPEDERENARQALIRRFQNVYDIGDRYRT